MIVFKTQDTVYCQVYYKDTVTKSSDLLFLLARQFKANAIAKQSNKFFCGAFYSKFNEFFKINFHKFIFNQKRAFFFAPRKIEIGQSMTTITPPSPPLIRHAKLRIICFVALCVPHFSFTSFGDFYSDFLYLFVSL